MHMTLHIAGQPAEIEVLERTAGLVRFRYQGTVYAFHGHRAADGSVWLDSEAADGIWRRQRATLTRQRNGLLVQLGALDMLVSQQPSVGSAAQAAASLSPLTPMPGLVRKICVKKGASVKAGDALAVLEAMKLQLTLSAGGDGIVEDILASEGEMVPEGAMLVKLADRT